MNFARHPDGLQFKKYYVQGLLERGIKVLVYAGNHDWIWHVLHPLTLTKCTDSRHHVSNHVGNLQWTEALEWTGYEAYNQQPLCDWFVALKKRAAEVVGETRPANGECGILGSNKPEQWFHGDEP
jgi:carboxypeptidase C (cathepsin A)